MGYIHEKTTLKEGNKNHNIDDILAAIFMLVVILAAVG